MLTAVGKKFSKMVSDAIEPTQVVRQRGLNRLLDANSREGFAALRANQRKSTTEKLEMQGDKQIEELKKINTGVNELAQNVKLEQTISIPGKSG